MSSDADRDYVDGVLREICADFSASLEAAANGSVAERYAAVPSWYAAQSDPTAKARRAAAVPSWCIDAATARSLLADIRHPSPRSER